MTSISAMGKFINLILGLLLISGTSYGNSFMGILKKIEGSPLSIRLDITNADYKGNPGQTGLDTKNYSISFSNEEIQSELNRLHNGDLIIGQGERNEALNHLEILSIDYVGLTNLLGVWLGENIIFKFKNFNEFTRYEFDSKKSKKYSFSIWNYSLSPIEDGWALFFSDESITNLARLALKNDRAILDIINVETGEIVSSTPLYKPKLSQ